MKRDISIDQAGRIVLPSEVRRQLNLGPGSRLRIAVVAERIELTPEPEPDPSLVSTPTNRVILPVTVSSRPVGTCFTSTRSPRPSRY